MNNESILFVVMASWFILVGLFLSDKYLLKTQAASKLGNYAVALHHTFDLVAVVLMFGGAYLLLLVQKTLTSTRAPRKCLWDRGSERCSDRGIAASIPTRYEITRQVEMPSRAR